ncbi:hypothetical protein ACFQ0K_08635 [Nocardioides caeni]|uniref:Uncharacterized protein n=1 Tax=Nocardioides caeni TaxID=574700 RepID=A0A4S8N3P0_9ACTN|nr:hypothetical protein [Nocardioides caeni]THV10465.1 hypothetical protein E9934_14135 [Nocardioides caeni]
MSREPTSPAHRYREALGRSGALDPLPQPEAPPARDPLRKPQPPNRRRKPKSPTPTRGYHTQREQALTKLTTTTEALTAEERQIIRGYRLSIGGEAAEAARREIEREVRRS